MWVCPLRQPLHNAAINGHIDVVKWLWGQRGRYDSLDLQAPSKDGWQARTRPCMT